MKSSPVSLLLGVSVLLLSGLTVSAVYLNVGPNLQQFFTRDPPVSLSCVEDGQTVDGWTVKRNRGGHIEECGAAGSDFRRFNSSSCVLDLSKPFTTDYWCESSDQVTITVTDKELILEIPALPVLTGSDVTLSCRNRYGDKMKAYFYKKGKVTEDKLQKITVSKVQRSDEGLYSCSTDVYGKSPQSRLRVRDPPTTSDPHIITALYPARPFNNTDDKVSSSSLIITVVAALGSLVLLLVVVGVVQLRRKRTGRKGSSTPVDVTYADVTIRQTANRRGPAEVTYGKVVIKNPKKAGRRTEQLSEPDVVYSSVRAGK